MAETETERGGWSIGVDIGGTYINIHFRMLCHARPPNISSDIKLPSVS